MPALMPAQRRDLAAIRKMISSSDFEVFWSGIQTLYALNDPVIYAIFAEGLSVDSAGRIVIERGCEVHRRAKAVHRQSLALEALHLAGVLQGVTRLDLTFSKYMRRVDGLASATAMTHLSLRGCVSLRSVEPLASCTALEELDLGDCRLLKSVAPLGACTSLRRLLLTHCRGLKSLEGLKGCTSLSHLDLFLCRGLRGRLRKPYPTRAAVVALLGTM